MFGFWRCMYLILLIYWFSSLKNTLKDVTNCRNFYVPLTSDSCTDQPHFCSLHKVFWTWRPSFALVKEASFAICHNCLLDDNQLSVFFILFLNSDDPCSASGLSQPKNKKQKTKKEIEIEIKPSISKNGRWQYLQGDSPSDLYFYQEYKAERLLKFYCCYTWQAKQRQCDCRTIVEFH